MAQRITEEEDINRLAERVSQYGRGRVKDVDSFNEVFNDFMDIDDKPLTARQDGILRKKVMSSLMAQDEKFKARVQKKEFKEVETFLTEFDEVEKQIKVSEKKGKFDIATKSKGRVVFAQRLKVKVRGKETLRYRDRLGRWANKPE